MKHQFFCHIVQLQSIPIKLNKKDYLRMIQLAVIGFIKFKTSRIILCLIPDKINLQLYKQID